MVCLAVLIALLKAFVAATVAHIHHVACKMKLLAQIVHVCAQFIAKVMIPHSNVLSFGANVVHLPFVKLFGEIFAVTVVTALARPARLHLPARLLCLGLRFAGSSCAEVPTQCIAARARLAAHLLHACAKIVGMIVPGHAYSSSVEKMRY